MWPFKDRFALGLRHRARQLYVQRRPSHDSDDTLLSIDTEPTPFEVADLYPVGELAALILAQAQRDGARQVLARYTLSRLFYTIDGVDYEMVPPPWAVYVELVRGLARMVRLDMATTQNLVVSFADDEIEVSVSQQMMNDEPTLAITGFSGEIPERLARALRQGRRGKLE